MQMIDVLKRLAELDSANPNRPEYVVQSDQNINTTIVENKEVTECGMMMDRPSTPASINMTAANGDELGDLLKAIITLAGHKDHDHDHEEPLRSTPTLGIASIGGMGMKSMMDKLNDIEDETYEDSSITGVSTSPADPNDLNEFDPEQYAHHENNPGSAKGRNITTQPQGVPTLENQIWKNLMIDYDNFLSENTEIPSPDLDANEGFGRRGFSYNPDRDAGREWDAERRSDQDFRSRERNVGVEHETNNIQVEINGKRWKVFPGRGPADSMEERAHLEKMKRWAERKSLETGKEWKVYITGAPPTI